MRKEELGTYEMQWDCPYCGTDKLLGLTHRHCPNCGGAQDPQTRYYPSDENKVAVEHHVYVGADLVCPACNTPNSAHSTFCGGCGNPLEVAKQAAARADQVAGGMQAFVGETVKDAKAEARARRDAQAAAARGKPSAPPMARGLKIAIIVGSVLLVIALVVAFLLLWKKEATLEVERLTWERSIAVEVFGPVKGSTWCDQMPAKAYSVSRTKAVRSHSKVADGEECSKRRVDNRDGTFKEVMECQTKYREEPVYDQKCSYTVDKWAEDRTETARGQGTDPEPSWPVVVLSKPGDCKGCEREGDKTEVYTVEFIDRGAGDTHTCEFPLPRWQGMAVGSSHSAKIGIATGALDCDSLEPAP